jgi:hypothetical protein
MFKYEISILDGKCLSYNSIQRRKTQHRQTTFVTGGRGVNSNNKKYALLAMVTISLSVLLAMPLSLTPGIADDSGTRGLAGTIESASVDMAPTIDGDGGDTVWENGTASTAGAGAVDVDITSVFTATDIYFRATWSDSTESSAKKEWSLNVVSSEWEQDGDEDRLALTWNISTVDFNEQGCDSVCHIPDMNTSAPGETMDTWHWKAARTNPSGWLDDKFFNSTGRQADNKNSGGYSDNKQTLDFTDDPANSTDVPKYWEPMATGADALSITQAEIDAGEAKNITGVFTNGALVDEDSTILDNATLIPGFYSSRPTGSRGDVEAKGTFAGGAWTVEWGRPLDTGNSDDIQFDDTSADAEYFFGVAAFDDTGGMSHTYSMSDVYRLVFEQPPVNQNPDTPTITPSVTTAEIDEVITFDVSATDPDGDTLTYSWDFGDSTTGDGASATHAYTEAGTYTVTVTADDGNGGTSTATQSITVEAAAEDDDAGIDIIWILLVIIIIVVVVIVAVVAMKKRGPPLEDEPLEEEPLAEEPLGEEE